MKNSFISSFENSHIYKLRMKPVFLFLFLFLALLVCFEIINRHFVTQQSENFSIIHSFTKEKNNITILFLGDSHFQQGINVSIIGNHSFNLSPPGASYIQSYYLLKTYIIQLPSLKTVVIPLDLHSFSSFRSNRIPEAYFWNQFIDYSELAKIKGPSVWLKKLQFLTILDESFGREHFVDNLLHWALGDNSNRLIEPGTPVFQQTSPVKEDYQRVEFQFHNQEIFDKDLLLYFKKILQQCQEHHIQLITLQMPASSEYIQYSSKYITNEQIHQDILSDSTYQKLINKNIDCVSLYIDHNDYFQSDGDHLNPKGSIFFSNYLAKQMLEN